MALFDDESWDFWLLMAVYAVMLAVGVLFYLDAWHDRLLNEKQHTCEVPCERF